MSEVLDPAPSEKISALKSDVAPAPVKAGLATAHHDAIKSKPAPEGFVPMAASVERVASGDQSVAHVHGDNSAREEKDSGKKNASVQAKDFFLDRSELSSGVGGPQGRTVLASAVGCRRRRSTRMAAGRPGVDSSLDLSRMLEILPNRLYLGGTFQGISRPKSPATVTYLLIQPPAHVP